MTPQTPDSAKEEGDGDDFDYVGGLIGIQAHASASFCSGCRRGDPADQRARRIPLPQSFAPMFISTVHGSGSRMAI